MTAKEARELATPKREPALDEELESVFAIIKTSAEEGKIFVETTELQPETIMHLTKQGFEVRNVISAANAEICTLTKISW